MYYERLKTFIKYDVLPEENYEFVMIKSLSIASDLSRESIAKDIRDENPDKRDTDFIKIPVYDNLVRRGVVKESDGAYTLVGNENFSVEQKRKLVKLCKERVDEVKDRNKIKKPKYWKIAPGEQAKDWENQKNNGIVGIGWNDLEDLKGLSEEQVRQKILEKYHSSIGSVGSQFKNFLKIKRGDIIIANKGKSKVVGIGKVIGNYQFKPEQEFAHTYPVDWFWTEEKEIPLQNNWFVTVVPIPIEIYKIIISPKQLSKTKISFELEDLIEEFDKNPSLYDKDKKKWVEKEEREREHQKFVTLFPIDKLLEIEIDKYVIGKPDPLTKNTNRNTFCYILDQELEHAGGIPSSADKYGIYFNKNRHDYIFKKEFRTSEEAFVATKRELFSIVEAGKEFQTEKNWDRLSEIVDRTGQQQIASHVRSKLLAVYFPESFLAIHAAGKIDTLLNFLKIPNSKLRTKQTMKQAKLLEVKNSHKIMRDWDVYKYSLFLFNVVIPFAEKSKESKEVIVEEDEESKGNEGIDYSIDHLPTPTPDNLDELKKTIAQKILIQDEKLEEIIAALVMGKSVLLTGAVGTGKTHLATILPQIAWKEYGGYYSMLYTATSDWTTQNVIGGIIPKVDSNKKIIYEIQKGCISNTVSKNWKEETSNSNERTSFEAKNMGDELQKFKGVWLVIDEFNRANIDKSFGQMFTALEYKEMQIPTINPKESFEELIIPEDYRIIGTLNTADKHYLHSLSDALKRRFSIIEISIPEYDQKDNELYFVVSKATENLVDANVNLALSHEQGVFVRGKGDSDVENIVDTLYTVMSFIREIKPLGTALLISMLRFMIINHSLELVKKANWDSSLDGALVTSIIPQIEDLNYWTLKVIKAALCGNLASFFENDPEIKNDNEKYKKDFQKMVKCIKKIKGEKRNNIEKRFADGKLGKNKTKKDDGTEIPDEDITYLTIWTAENTGKKPYLPKFTSAINQIISEKGLDEEIEE